MLLTWHVDYWDRLGWEDPYGSEEASERQSRYAKVHENGRRWTPQFVVDGKIIQNREARAIPELVKRAHAAEAPVSIDASATLTERAVGVTMRLRAAEEDWTPGASVQVRPVLVRRTVTTEVPRGENEGRTLTEHFVVLATGKPRPAEAALAEEGARSTIPLPEGQDGGGLSVAILVEEPSTMRTLQCVSVEVTRPDGE